MRLLDSVKSPADLKKLPVRDLPALAQEIRELIISTVSRNGGHMASNLGVVELTIALHRLFDSPTDRIIFDVSHQSYTHKILTGRANGFKNIRTSQGYSGYFEPGESEHDVLALGHAGCAASIALGLALAARMKGDPGYFVAVIGDGSLTSGLAYEGLSNIIAQNPRNLMVILNDNGMAISANVGWLATWRGKWLPHLRAELELDQDFQQFESVTEALAPKIPLGPLALSLGKGLKSAIQKTLIPEIGHVWDEMGFNYLGPADGHNITELIEMIDRARQYSDKVPFLHVLTNKGQGWTPATEDPTRYHQPGPPKEGPRKKTYSQVFSQALLQIMTEDQRVVAISAAMLEGTGLVAVKKVFPERVFDVGICEQHAVSMAAGMARAGLKPVVCIYSTFLQRSFDQIIQDICMNKLPVVFALDRAGIVGQDGKTHHGLYDLAYMRIPPNMVVAVPKDENEMRHMLWTALHESKAWAIRYPRGEVFGVALEDRMRPVSTGTSEVIREGKIVCLAGVGEAAYAALDAAQELDKHDIKCQVVNVRFIKPVDKALVAELCDNFSEVFVIEEGTSIAGAASAMMEAIEALREEGYPNWRTPPRVHTISVGDSFPDHGEVGELRHQFGLDAHGIAQRVLNIIKGGE
ncbi:1-deoxy-D-xylulose-5-phosphate synthase [subsurface metagenome]